MKNEVVALNILESARYYLAGLPFEDQNFSVNPITNQLTNEAIPLIHRIERQILEANHHGAN